MKLLNLPQQQKKPLSWVEQRTRQGRVKLHLIERHRFAAMRLVEERSLASILRSNLLTTLINNDVSGKVNASGVRERFGQISRRMHPVVASEATGPQVRLRNSSISMRRLRLVPIPLFEKLSDKFVPGSCRTGSGIRFGSNRFF